MNTLQTGITRLLRSAITGEHLTLPEEFSLEEAMTVIKRQNLEALVFQGALNCGISEQDPSMITLMQKYISLLLHSEKQLRAIQQLYAAFEENKIDYLPMKGCNMKSLYPKPELRSMGDADILIRVEQYDRIEEVMTTLGFDLARISQYDYEWRRKDLIVELHYQLIPPRDQTYNRYFGDGWNRAVKGEGFQYHFSREDTFLYLFTHMTKHYRHKGIGSRHMLDLYVYLRANPDMDEAYIETEMEKLQLLTFYRNIRHMLMVWFENGVTDDVTEYITSYVFSGGSWGLAENGAATEILRCSKGNEEIRCSRRRMQMQIVFPSAKKLEWKYPVLRKAPWLVPLIWVHRWFEVLLLRPDRIKKRISGVVEISDEKILERQRALRYVGLFQFEEA